MPSPGNGGQGSGIRHAPSPFTSDPQVPARARPAPHGQNKTFASKRARDGGRSGTPSRCGPPLHPVTGRPGDRTRSLFTMSNNTPTQTRGRCARSSEPDRRILRMRTRGPRPPRSDRPAPQAMGRGGARRDRTDDLMLAKHALSQLSYGPKGSGAQTVVPEVVVGLGRLERPTSPLSGVRSNHLSYRPGSGR